MSNLTKFFKNFPAHILPPNVFPKKQYRKNSFYFILFCCVEDLFICFYFSDCSNNLVKAALQGGLSCEYCCFLIATCCSEPSCFQDHPCRSLPIALARFMGPKVTEYPLKTHSRKSSMISKHRLPDEAPA